MPPSQGYRQDQPPQPLTGLAKEILDQVAAWRIKHGLPPLQRDSRLDTMALEYCRQARDLKTRVSRRLIDFIAHWVGLTDPVPDVNYIEVPRGGEAKVAPAIEDVLPEIFQDSSLTHGGVAELDIPGEPRRLALTFASRLVELAPLARTAMEPQLTLAGRLSPAVRGGVTYITPPWTPGKEPPAVVRLPLTVTEGAFSIRLPLEHGPGRYQVELVADGDHGPAVLSLFPVYLQVPPPQRFHGVATVSRRSYGSPEEAELAMVGLINADRAAFGLPPVRLEPSLTAVARAHSVDMYEGSFVGHRSPTTGELEDRLAQARLDVAAAFENVAKGESIAEIQENLMSSPGHRANVLQPLADHVGVGIFTAPRPGGDFFYLVTQAFARFPRTLDLAQAPAQVLAIINRARASLSLPAMVEQPAMSAVAMNHVRLFFEGPQMDQEERSELLATDIARVNLSYTALQVLYLAGKDLDLMVELKPEWLKAFNAAGVGVFQGEHPGQRGRTIGVVLILMRTPW